MDERTYTTLQVELNGAILSETEQEVQSLLNLNPQTIKWHGLRRGDVLVFRAVQVTVTVETYKEHRHGFTGQIRERVTHTKEEVISEDPPRKLWRTADKRGWYWIIKEERCQDSGIRKEVTQ